MKKVHVVTSHLDINKVWVEILQSRHIGSIQSSTLYDIRCLSHKDINNVDLWIIETFINDDPVGFRTALSLADDNRILLVINPPINSIKLSEGDFWITYSFRGDLIDKVEGILSDEPKSRSDYDKLIELYPELVNPPKNTHR